MRECCCEIRPKDDYAGSFLKAWTARQKAVAAPYGTEEKERKAIGLQDQHCDETDRDQYFLA